MSKLVYFFAIFGALSLLIDFALVSFFLWFSYDTHQTFNALDEMQDEDES
jgi:hypothetical protein